MGTSVLGIFCLAASLFVVCTSRAAQVPLFTNEPSFDFGRTPSVNATGNLIFASASSLLQHWPNTRYRNGHSVVPGIISPGTLLYHGRRDPTVPQVPEWTATDPEHSYLFCRPWMGPPNEGENCWHLTLVATRPLNVLHFDGSSGAKMDGALDSQDIMLDWMETVHERSPNEHKRIQHLCKWGKSFGIDAFVRMEMDFEIMLCNFTAGVDVVSMLNLHELLLPENGPVAAPGEPDYARPDEVVLSGSWHNHFPGETRIQLDYSRLLSFYDTTLAPSLVDKRFGKDRLQHRIDGISKADLNTFMERLEEVLQRPHGQSLVDWRSVLHITVTRFSDRLENVQYLLNQTHSSASPVSLPELKRVQRELSLMIQPYALLPLSPKSDDSNNHSWAFGTFEQCAITQTSYLHKIPDLTSSELGLLRAIEETNTEICRVVTTMWAEGIEAGLDTTIPMDIQYDSMQETVVKWNKSINQLIHWLDWSVWLKCRPACAYDAICYLPTWPYFGTIGVPPKMPPDENEDTRNPMPRCLPRFVFLE